MRALINRYASVSIVGCKLRGWNLNFLFRICVFLYFFAGTFQAYSGCRDHLGLELPPLPHLKDVDLYRPMESLTGVRDSVVAAILHNGKLLMLQRGGEIGRGSWGLVGGKKDEGESLAQTLEWEVWEEVGLESLHNYELIHVHYHVAPESLKTFRVFVIKVDFNPAEIPEIKEPDKILDLGWFPLTELPQPLFANFEVYKNLLNETSGDKN